MKQPTKDLRLSGNGEKLILALTDIISRANDQLNRLTEGRLSAVHNASTTFPTTGIHAQGDFVRNTSPTELGVAGSKYVIIGWVCTVSGEPGTWVQCRYLTGN